MGKNPPRIPPRHSATGTGYEEPVEPPCPHLNKITINLTLTKSLAALPLDPCPEDERCRPNADEKHGSWHFLVEVAFFEGRQSPSAVENSGRSTRLHLCYPWTLR